MENKDPSGDGAAKQEAASKKYEEKAERLLKFHRQDSIFAPTAFFGIVSAYLLFVGAVTGVGMLASYSHHETTANVFLIISIPLLLIAPVGVIWYLFVRFRKPRAKTDKKSLLDRVFQTSFGASLRRIGNNPITRIFQFAIPVLMIADAINKFPLHPRFSLAVTVTYTLFASFLISFEVARSFETAVRKEVAEIWEFNDLVRNALFGLKDGVDLAFKGHETNVRTIHDLLGVLRTMNAPVQVIPTETGSEQLDDPNANKDA